jgi:hypothetical protein
MASLDVSEVITDPLFTSPVTLVRVKEASDAYGDPVWDDAEKIEVSAVVTADQKTISRLPEALQRTGAILVRVASAGVPPEFGAAYDAVLWRGKRFVVKDCADYTKWGSGFLRLTCWPEEISDGRY